MEGYLSLCWATSQNHPSLLGSLSSPGLSLLPSPLYSPSLSPAILIMAPNISPPTKCSGEARLGSFFFPIPASYTASNHVAVRHRPNQKRALALMPCNADYTHDISKLAERPLQSAWNTPRRVHKQTELSRCPLWAERKCSRRTKSECKIGRITAVHPPSSRNPTL